MGLGEKSIVLAVSLVGAAAGAASVLAAAAVAMRATRAKPLRVQLTAAAAASWVPLAVWRCLLG